MPLLRKVAMGDMVGRERVGKLPRRPEMPRRHGYGADIAEQAEQGLPEPNYELRGSFAENESAYAKTDDENVIYCKLRNLGPPKTLT
jgi:hypothetical protein